jgi:hypothetical protein
MNTVERLCELPMRWYEEGASWQALIEQLQTPLIVHPVTVAGISEHLRAHPALVQQWLNWSGDQRSSSAWYFDEENGKYMVGFYPGGPVEYYADAVVACAAFIVKTVGLPA